MWRHIGKWCKWRNGRTDQGFDLAATRKVRRPRIESTKCCFIYHMIPSIIYLVKTAATLLKTSGQWVRFLVPENANNTSGKDSAIVTGYVKSIGFAKVTRCAKDAVFQSCRVCQSYRVFQSCRACQRSKWAKGMGCVKGIIRQWCLQCIYLFIYCTNFIPPVSSWFPI